MELNLFKNQKNKLHDNNVEKKYNKMNWIIFEY